ncbi:MAG: PIN domain-containing protein [Deltaproteobacteria bacterium]|nr:PIN domain-containing protein [Deltaproteobacteria bacterium]
MRSFLIDTGPIVALLNGRDRHHAWIRDLLRTVEPPLHTCEAVLSEACFLLRQLEGGADAVLELCARGVLRAGFSFDREQDEVRMLMRKYANVPMSLADACLVRMTELDDDSVLLTLDSDFRIYRRHRRRVVPLRTPG